METLNLNTELLNPAQQEAVNHIDGPMLVLAGPGSGKTRVVTHRIANLIAHGIAPRNILAMTFTNKAADEMKSRVEQLVPTAGRKLWVSTFHKFCAWQIRMHGEIVGLKDNYTIYDTADSKRLFKMVLDRLKPEYKFTPAGLINEISRLKSQMILPEDFNPSPRNGRQCALKQIYEEYQAALLTANAVDFDDMLIHTVTMLKKDEELRAELDARYRYVLVDEYQDTNAIQYEIVKLLNRDYQNIQVTGDPDQSIYGWRGAEIRNILDFEKDYPNVKTVRLEKNYRSTPEILHVADELIANNRQRKEKTLFTDNKSGAPVHLVCLDDEFDEAEFVAKKVELLVKSGLGQPNDIAVFYRTNAQSRPFEEKFNIYNLPYILVNAVEFFQRKEIKDVMAYLRLLSNPMDDVSFVRIVNCPARGIGDATVEKLADYAQQQGIPLLQAAWEVERIPTIKGKSKAAIQDFIRIMNAIFELTGTKLQPLVEQILDLSGYRAQYADSKDEDDINRLANVDEFLNVASAFDERHADDENMINPLTVFLEETALVADSDKLNSGASCVSLMTIHSAKGLEFPYVFVVGLEDGLLPHKRSMESSNENDLEEERRLLFVAITRAKKELFLTHAARRRISGYFQSSPPSQFLMELPRNEMDASGDKSNTFYNEEPDIDDSELNDYPDDFPDRIPTGKKRWNSWRKKKPSGNSDGFCDEITDTRFTDEW